MVRNLSDNPTYQALGRISPDNPRQSRAAYLVCGLLQLRLLRLRRDKNGNVGVGVFPECEEILIRSLGFGGVAL